MKNFTNFPTAALSASGYKGIISAPPLRAPPNLQCKDRKNPTPNKDFSLFVRK
jgi:hypothetical protein